MGGIRVTEWERGKIEKQEQQPRGYLTGAGVQL